MSSHTPGPWKAVDQDDNGNHTTMIFGGRNMGGLIAIIPNIHPGDQPGSLKDARDANARLIASAPMLLAALEALLGPWNAGKRFIDMDADAVAALRDAGNAAIAQAKGE